MAKVRIVQSSLHHDNTIIEIDGRVVPDAVAVSVHMGVRDMTTVDIRVLVTELELDVVGEVEVCPSG